MKGEGMKPDMYWALISIYRESYVAKKLAMLALEYAGKPLGVEQIQEMADLYRDEAVVEFEAIGIRLE